MKTADRELLQYRSGLLREQNLEPWSASERRLRWSAPECWVPRAVRTAAKGQPGQKRRESLLCERVGPLEVAYAYAYARQAWVAAASTSAST